MTEPLKSDHLARGALEYNNMDYKTVNFKLGNQMWKVNSWNLVAQRIERPPGVREVMGSIPVGDSDFLCWSVFHNWSPSLKFTGFSHLFAI